MKKIYSILTVITVLAFFLRVYDVSSNPPALAWDEASIGYNAFAILRTGADEHGRFLPLDTFTAFGDYKPPIPVDPTVPFVAVFGLTELAVRLPSVLAGTLTVMFMYFLVLELFKTTGSAKASSINHQASGNVALFSAAFLAITPWHIMLSRAGFEGNIAFLFIVFGVWMILRARRYPTLYIYALLPFVAGIYTFNSARYAGPLIALAAYVFSGRSIVRQKRNIVLGILVSLIALAPILPHLFSKEARLRYEEVNIFSNLSVILTSNTRRDADGFIWWSNILHNRRLSYAYSYAVHFLDNMEPRFLFVKGDGNPKFSIQDAGQLLLITAPFLAYGAIRLFLDAPGIFWFLLAWLIFSIAPAAVARETPHALRVENGLPFYIVLISYGMLKAIRALPGGGVRGVVAGMLVVAVTGNFVYFWHNLTRHYPQEYSGTWQYGYKQATAYVQDVKDQYNTIVLSENIGRPYIYTLFYEATDPAEFRRSMDSSFDAEGFYNVYGYGKYRFVREDAGTYHGRTLYILPPSEVPDAATIKKEIKLLNGETILVVFET